MANDTYRYTIFDMTEDKYIIRNATSDEASAKINIPKTKLASYATSGFLWKRRYSIQKEKIYNGIGVEADKDRPQKVMDNRLKQEWDNARFRINPKARA